MTRNEKIQRLDRCWMSLLTLAGFSLLVAAVLAQNLDLVQPGEVDFWTHFTNVVRITLLMTCLVSGLAGAFFYFLSNQARKTKAPKHPSLRLVASRNASE